MQPYVPVAPLTLPPDAAIDLHQMHTTFSDGRWTDTDRASGPIEARQRS